MSFQTDVAVDVDGDDDQLSILAQRRVPRLYIIDASGDVMLRGREVGSLKPETHDLVTKLLANHRGEDLILGLSAAGNAVRLVRLSGAAAAHYALFIEPASRRSPIDDASRRFGLSEREREILRHLLSGASTAEIAERLFIAHSTVASHVRNIGAKMNASKRKEIVAAVLGAT